MSTAVVIKDANFASVRVSQLEFNKIAIIGVVSPNGSGIISQSGNGYYNEGDTVTLTATPNSGYVFSQWLDDDTLPAQRAIIVGSSDTTYTAVFISDPSIYSNEFTWGKGGIDTWGKSSGRTNDTMSTINYAIHTIGQCEFSINQNKPYVITGYIKLSNNADYGFSAIGSYISGLSVDNLTVEPGKYIQISVKTTNGNNADLSDGSTVLGVTGNYELVHITNAPT